LPYIIQYLYRLTYNGSTPFSTVPIQHLERPQLRQKHHFYGCKIVPSRRTDGRGMLKIEEKMCN
jgi:hypothetical protein